jgi:hypothetical protein
MDEADFARVVEQGRALQQRFPELRLIAVGGTAAALHCRHRYSLDVDEVTPLLQPRYDEIAQALEAWEGWQTNRRNPPVLILGERQGVEIGLRQQRRAVPLRTIEIQALIIPTLPEMLRVKAFLLAQRRATRDYVDVAALAATLGNLASGEALGYLNLAYPAPGPQSAISGFAEACEAEPADLASVDLAAYKGLKPPFTNAGHVLESCRRLGRSLIKLELEGRLPSELDSGFQ